MPQISQLWKTMTSTLMSVFSRPTIMDLLDVILVAVLIYQLLLLTQKTRANQVLKGFAIILLISWLTNLLELRALNWLLNQVVSAGTFVLVVLFQPELRRGLEEIGRGTIISDTARRNEHLDSAWVIEELVAAIENMSRRRVGALIVIERKTPMTDIIATGTRLDACLSRPLIENIFEPNTPLHDGAMIIRNDRIVAAGCVLSLSQDRQISYELGTRHRAALGTSEQTDAYTFIVSEESGIISIAKEGKLRRYLDGDAIRELLAFYSENETGGLRNAWRKWRSKP